MVHTHMRFLWNVYPCAPFFPYFCYYFYLFGPLPPTNGALVAQPNWGGSGPKTHWGMRLLDKIMILQGVKPTIQPLGVGYANRPKKAQNGGYVAISPIYAWLCSNNLCKVILLPSASPPCPPPPPVRPIPK